MKKRLLTLITAFALALSLCPTALAGGDVRDTHFFTDQNHADLTWAEIIADYEHVEMEPIQEEIDAVRALAAGAANLREVRRRYDALTDRFLMFSSMYAISSIRYFQNCADTAAYSEYAYNASLGNVFADALSALTRDILNSPCAAALDKLTEEDIAYYRNYRDMTGKQLTRAQRETDLVNQYADLYDREFTFPYEGVEYTAGSAYAACLRGEISYDEYIDIYYGAKNSRADALGGIFMQLLPIRQETAREAGYANYMEYAYAELYGRDYTPEEIIPYEEAVKEYIMPLYQDLQTLYFDLDAGIFSLDFSGDTALNTVEPYIGRMSSELLEAWTFMRTHGLYDNTVSANKYGTGFTTVLRSGNVPFLFNNASGGVSDLTTVIHEFGHYNHYFWHPNGFYDPTVSYDLAEVHSQGLELVFSHWYPEIFGTDGEELLLYQMFSIVYSLYQGSIMDELQRYIYTTPGVTLDRINAEFERLSGEYGVPRFSDWDWVDIPHTFDSPGYYISYSVSAAGALSIWLDSVEGDFLDAVDTYLKFTALPAGMSFQDSFRAVGYDNPVSPAYIQALAKALRTALNVDERLLAPYLPPYLDVPGDAWYAGVVEEMSGILRGVGGHMFFPNEDADRGAVVEALWHLSEDDGAYADVFVDLEGSAYAEAANWAYAKGIVKGVGGSRFDPDGSLTREQAVVMLYRLAENPALPAGVDGLSAYWDADEVSSWAEDAMAWALEAGIVNGVGGMTLAPRRSVSRAQLAAMLSRFLDYAGAA